MSKAFRFGVIGCGMISHFHAKAIAEIEDVEITACTSRGETNRKGFAEKWNAKPFATPEEMIDSDLIDAVTICSASGAHMEPAVYAAKKKKHVVVEKPLEITLDRCDQIIKACKNEGVKLCTIFPSRFTDSSQLVKQTVDSGRLGRLTLCDAYIKWWRTQAYYDDGGWKGTKALDGGGALMNQGIHAVDMLQWLAGDVASIMANVATLAHQRIEVEDTAVASLVFKNGALGTIEGTTSVFPGYLKRLELSGDKGTIVLEEADIKAWDFEEKQAGDDEVLQKFGAKTDSAGGAADPAAINHENHRRQLADFAKAVRENGQPMVDGAEGRKAVEIILGIYESSEKGKRIDL